MEDDGRAVLGEDLAHALLLLAVGEHGREFLPGDVALVLQLALDREEVVLGMVEQDDPARLHAGDLTRELRADRATGPGDEHRLPREVGADAVELHVHRLAAEHVLHAHLTHLPGDRAVILEQLEHGRKRADGDAPLATLADDAPAGGPGRRGDRDDDFVRLGLLQDARKVALGVAADPDPVDAQPPLAGVIVEEAHRVEPELAVACDLPQDEPPAVAGAHDQHAAVTLASTPEDRQRTALVDAAREHAHAEQKQQAEQEEQHGHAVGQGDRRRAVIGLMLNGPQDHDRHDREQDDRDDRPHDRLVVALTGVAPAALIDT